MAKPKQSKPTHKPKTLEEYYELLDRILKNEKNPRTKF